MSNYDKALKIAEYIHHETDIDIILSNQWEWLYSSFDGLIQFIEKVNSNSKCQDSFSIYSTNVIVYVNNNYATSKIYDYGYGGLIDALQDAIIFYYENRKGYHVMQIDNELRTNEMDEITTIHVEKLRRLLKIERWLNELKERGIENWDGYYTSLEEFEEIEENRNEN